MSFNDIRRVVTAHNANGKAIIAEDGRLPYVNRVAEQPGLVFHEIWNTDAMPMPLSFSELEPTGRYRDLAPPSNGTIIRFVDIPPEGYNGPEISKDQAKALFQTVGLHENRTPLVNSRHPLMHRTESIDYGVVIAGEIVLLLDEEEVLLRAGDVVVQRGTIHAWANRSDNLCRMLFVLTDASLDPELKAAQAAQDAQIVR